MTPAEGGALDYSQEMLGAGGIRRAPRDLRRARHRAESTISTRASAPSVPNLMFAGHTDVVPPGDEAAWTHPPFAGEIADGVLYGRGAVDMKGGIACFVAAALDHLAAHGGKPQGLALVPDHRRRGGRRGQRHRQAAEMGGRRAARNSTTASSASPAIREALGDMIKIGRRGSLNGTLIVTGTPGPRRLSAIAPTTRSAASRR